MAVDKIETLTLRGCVTDKQKRNKKPRAIVNFSETLGAIPLKFCRVGRGHSYLHKNP